MKSSPQKLRLMIHEINRDMPNIQQMFDETQDMSWFYKVQELKKERQRLNSMLNDLS